MIKPSTGQWQLYLRIFAALVPALELYGIQAWLWEALHFPTNFVQGLLTLSAVLFILYRKCEPLRFQRSILYFNIATAVFFMAGHTLVVTELIGDSFWTLMVFSSMLIFVDPVKAIQRIREEPQPVYFAIVIFWAQFGYFCFKLNDTIKRFVWHDHMAYPTTRIIRAVLELFGYQVYDDPRPSVIINQYLGIAIAAPCSGFEGVMFFLTFFSLVLMLDYKSLSRKEIAIFYALGTFIMLLLNIIRLSIFFMVGQWATKTWGRQEGTRFAIQLFHHNIGWVIYATGLGIFFVLFFRYIDKKNRRTA